VGLWTLAAAAHPTYQLTDVAPANSIELWPRINSAGAVAGSMFDGSYFRAFVYDDTGLQLLPLQGNGWNMVHGFSDKGEVAGYCQGLSDYEYRDLGCRWRPDGQARRPLRLGMFSYFTDVNGQGLATAYYWPRVHGPSHTRAVVVNRQGEVTELGKLGGEDTDAAATAINDKGWVVGYSSKVAYGPNYAFVYDAAGGMRELDAGGQPGRAFDVNEAGDAVGDNDAGGRPMLFRGGAATDLGTLTDEASAQATAINKHGDIVGCEKQVDVRHRTAVIWPGGKGPRRLTGLLDPVSGAGWTLHCATDINQAGQITGWGRRGDGVYRVFRLTPMP
jgi:probable HAF family extracellular repeat protein